MERGGQRFCAPPLHPAGAQPLLLATFWGRSRRGGAKKSQKIQFPPNFHQISIKFPPLAGTWELRTPQNPSSQSSDPSPSPAGPPKNYKTSEHEGKPSPGLAPLQAGLAAWVFWFFFACLEQRCMKKGGEAAPRRARGFWEKPSPPPCQPPQGRPQNPPPKGLRAGMVIYFFRVLDA